MINIKLRYQRRLNRQKDILKHNIDRAQRLNQKKIILKVQNTNKHIYLRVYNNSKVVLTTISTIKYRKDSNYSSLRTMQIIPILVNDLVKILNDIKVEIYQDNIIWYLGGGKYTGRIKLLIVTLLNKLQQNIELNKENE